VTADELFAIWAPDGCEWSAWAKPVLFAGRLTQQAAADVAMHVARAALLPAVNVPPGDGRTVVVVDLPGAASVIAGVDLAGRGYRPVPLFNAVAAAGGSTRAKVDVVPIVAALVDAAPALAGASLAAAAPPAFLIDEQRRFGRADVPLTPGVFDNRSVSLPTDFPSGNLLRARGIERCVVVQQSPDDQPQEDLRHTLLRWQQAGIAVELLRLGIDPSPRPVSVRRPGGFRSLWQRALAVMGLYRSPLGGFGGRIPEPSSGAG
jgi:hypothetical protein